MTDIAGVVAALREERARTSEEIGRLQGIAKVLDETIAMLAPLAGPEASTAEPEPAMAAPPSEDSSTAIGPAEPDPAPEREEGPAPGGPAPAASNPFETAQPAKRPWKEDDDELRRLWGAGVHVTDIADRLGHPVSSVNTRVHRLKLPKRPRPPRRYKKKPAMAGKDTSTPAATAAPKPKGQPLRRFTEHFDIDPESVEGLNPDHPALAEARTIFPSTVVEVADSPRLLVSGHNHRKIGDRVVKGPWAGMPIYCLTLEERATCPETCHHWSTCYGSNMPRARRHKHGPALQERLAKELIELAGKHPDGFVVRLHILGDFYSTEYAESWGNWLDLVPALHIFGYTARDPESEIGKAIDKINGENPQRCVIRWSDPEPGYMRATTIWRMPDKPVVDEGLVCPEQTGKTACCGTCGLCWADHMRETSIAFIAHGKLGRPSAPAKIEENRKAGAIWPAESRDLAESAAAPRPLEHGAIDGDAPFKKSVDRRCGRCGETFKSMSPNDTTCSLCLGGVGVKERCKSFADWAAGR